MSFWYSVMTELVWELNIVCTCRRKLKCEFHIKFPQKWSNKIFELYIERLHVVFHILSCEWLYFYSIICEGYVLVLQIMILYQIKLGNVIDFSAWKPQRVCEVVWRTSNWTSNNTAVKFCLNICAVSGRKVSPGLPLGHYRGIWEKLFL